MVALMATELTLVLTEGGDNPFMASGLVIANAVQITKLAKEPRSILRLYSNRANLTLNPYKQIEQLAKRHNIPARELITSLAEEMDVEVTLRKPE